MYFFTIMIIIAVFTMFCLTFFGSEIKCFIDWKRNCDESQECKRWREWKAKCRERKCVYFGEVRNCQYKYTITIGPLIPGQKLSFIYILILQGSRLGNWWIVVKILATLKIRV